ncbi:glycine-rich RNA-binding protein 2, mitochondrial-like [Daphnia pulicaria]|uniref:glycine-rich RNA-binding protein 2, mitochondrial-like n=1 Tax=Daphnia pulicaria TaxID=35523 RepID=UPI001EECAFBC|nr:glycine-rich RNA-binding protein 2, mitochondrial-like [Daphnia pulicaria]
MNAPSLRLEAKCIEQYSSITALTRHTRFKMKLVLMALVLVSLALLSPIRADEKMNKDSAADDFAAGMEGLNVDETKHRPIYILPRPFPVYGGYGGYGGHGGYGGYGGGYGGYGGGFGGYGYGHRPFYG